MPRLFSALEIPADIGSELALHRGGLLGARWVEPADYHVTLRFFGDVDRHMAQDLDEQLAEIAGQPFEVVLDGLDVFGGDKPRAIYARVQPNPLLNELQADIERMARKLGLPAEARKFAPHVTLARVRDTSPAELAGFLSAHPIIRKMSFRAGRIALMSSRDSIGGGPYVLEAAYPLGPTDPNRLLHEAGRR